MKTLLELIGSLGREQVAKDLSVDETTLSKIKSRQSVSASILARAAGCYGAEFDLVGTLRELRSEDFDVGAAAANAPEPAPASDAA